MGETKRASLGRHRAVCAHPERMEIEAEFVAWRSPAALAQQYGLADRAGVYRTPMLSGCSPDDNGMCAPLLSGSSKNPARSK